MVSWDCWTIIIELLQSLFPETKSAGCYVAWRVPENPKISIDLSFMDADYSGIFVVRYVIKSKSALIV